MRIREPSAGSGRGGSRCDAAKTGASACPYGCGYNEQWRRGPARKPAMLLDRYQRPLKDLRISVTDRCNFRCTYCMPLDKYEWIQKSLILSFEEIERLAGLLAQLGVEKIRLTGGEPMLRHDLELLVAKLAAVEGIQEICLTTNGTHLAEKCCLLKAAGLDRINVSIDTLDPAKFKAITKRGDLDEVLRGLMAAKDCGLSPIKINTVVEKGVNDDEILALVEFAREHGLGMRFIEYMDVGNANNWTENKLVPKRKILETIRQKYELRELGREGDRAPAVDYEYADGGGELGIIASVTEPFCGSCSRARLTADGKLVTCLFSDSGFDLRPLLRGTASDDEILEALRGVWSARTDRYSEQRLVALQSSDGYQPQSHRKIEMISLGG
jgi:GTP 3',8-cyclase